MEATLRSPSSLNFSIAILEGISKHATDANFVKHDRALCKKFLAILPKKIPIVNE